jgi:hypothetical protein
MLIGMNILNSLNNIFINECSYSNINPYSPIKLRNMPNGISLTNAVSYKFRYQRLTNTKDEIVSDLNTIKNVGS